MPATGLAYLCALVEIDDTLVADEVFSRRFLCDLGACKGACCVQGESGAPLEDADIAAMRKALPAAQQYMSGAGRRAVEAQGLYTIDDDGEYVTPLVEGAECAYAFFDRGGVARCSFEAAYRAGESDFIKPISCHLYPIRLSEVGAHTALNYHHWPVCNPARVCGAQAELPVYRFLREAIIRKFGEAYYADLERAAAYLEK